MDICNTTKLECSGCNPVCGNRTLAPDMPAEEIYKKIIDSKGHKHQIIKCIEEMSELIKELCKFVNDDYYNLEKIIDEHADVTITLSQVTVIMSRMGYKYEGMLQNRINYKNARLERRLEKVETYNYID